MGPGRLRRPRHRRRDIEKSAERERLDGENPAAARLERQRRPAKDVGPTGVDYTWMGADKHLWRLCGADSASSCSAIQKSELEM